MKPEDYTRANNFDRRCGYYQTKKVIELTDGGSILDVGCGWGEFTKQYNYHFKRIVGLDPEPELLERARKFPGEIEYVKGWGETFKLDEKFDVIAMNNLLEHVDDPEKLLRNCVKHLKKKGVIVAGVPNCNSITRQLGVLMGIINNTQHISSEEREKYGHQRVYDLESLQKEFAGAGIEVVDSGSIIYKPLPNDFLEMLCTRNGEQWSKEFLKALYKMETKESGGYLYIVGRRITLEDWDTSALPPALRRVLQAD